MHALSSVVVVGATLALVGGCSSSGGPTFPEGGCSTPATVLVHDEGTLRDALATAAPGDVVGVQGSISLTADLTIFNEGVTLTCAAPGSGLIADSASGLGYLVVVAAKNVTLERLRLDGTMAQNGTLLIENDGITHLVENTRITNDWIDCSRAGLCVYLVGGTGIVISDDHIEARGSQSGIHLQGGGANLEIPIDGAVVRHNTLVALSASGTPRFGAIRPVGGNDLTIVDNTISGPWSNGISAAAFTNSRVDSNRVSGATSFGIQFSDYSWVGPTPIISRGDLFRGNSIKGAGVSGIFVYESCGNAFVDNDLRGNANDLGITFHQTTGADTVRGSVARQGLIDDGGALDCDGDGTNDPNVIMTTAPRMARALSPVVTHPDWSLRGTVRSARGILVQ